MSQDTRPPRPRLHRIAKLVVAVGLFAMLAADEPNPPASAKQALTRLQGIVGDWRGVGLLRRGSTSGAWRQECGWSWEFGDQQTALTFKTDDAKFLRDGSVQWNAASEQYELVARGIPEGQTVKYTGKLDTGDLDNGGKLILEAADVPKSLPARISFRQVAGGDRLIVLYERRSGSQRFLRMAEVGYTRAGSNFGKGTSFIECVVTGGVGTIAVRHQGKTYYVCCSGCKDYFEADPEGVLAEFVQRKADEKKEAEAKDRKQG